MSVLPALQHASRSASDCLHEHILKRVCVGPAGVLLERQVVFFCPKIGLLTTAVLAMIPLLRPFAWQSMIMPVLPAHESMLHLLDAPVPFLLGLQVPTHP